MDILKRALPGLLTAFIIALFGVISIGVGSEYAKADKVNALEKRVIILEECQKHISNDLNEIKQNTKDISNFLLNKSF